jgi:hypothetical protein
MTSGVKLRSYQMRIVLAIKDSIIHQRGLTFVVVLPRQSGKNETQRHLFAWLMFRAAETGGYIVSVSPTFKPQTINAMERMRTTLDNNIGTRGKWKPYAGFNFRYGKSRMQFFSGEPTAKVVGATADLLLSVDEAQDIEQSKFDKDFDPMTASTNATRVFWGTVWTSQTLLARQMRVARTEQAMDGIQRLFFYTADDIGKRLKSYRDHVARVVAEKGRQHPLVKTQFFCEEIDAQSGLFHAGRRALMQGDQPAQQTPIRGHLYAFALDIAGQDETMLDLAGLGNPGRDSTTLSVIDVDLTTLATLQAPTYRVVQRHAWTGTAHLKIFGQLKALADTWRPQHIVIDATGVGEGLWALLDKTYPTRVLPVKFTQQAKSEIGYGFIAIIETGRFRDCASSAEVEIQYENCRSEILIGPQHTMRWGVPDGKRGPDGNLLHDDYITADALTAELDKIEWGISTPTKIARATDPLDDMRTF